MKKRSRQHSQKKTAENLKANHPDEIVLLIGDEVLLKVAPTPLVIMMVIATVILIQIVKVITIWKI